MSEVLDSPGVAFELGQRPGEGQNAHSARACVEQRVCAGASRGAGGPDVVDQQNMPGKKWPHPPLIHPKKRPQR